MKKKQLIHLGFFYLVGWFLKKNFEYKARSLLAFTSQPFLFLESDYAFFARIQKELNLCVLMDGSHFGWHSTQTCKERSAADEPEGTSFRHTLQQFAATQL